MSTIKRVSGDYTIQTLGANTVTISSALAANAVDMVINGNLTVSGSTSFSGNLSVTKIFTGNSNVDTSNPGGNVTIGVYGSSNVAVFANTGAYITGLQSVSGNITGANVNTGGLVSATGNVNGANLNTSGNVTISRDASVTQPTIRFSDTDTTATANTVVGAIEWYTGDITSPGARVSSALRSTFTDTVGSTRIELLTGNATTASVAVTILPTGNVGIANALPDTTFGVTGTAYISGNTTVAANIQGGNLSTGGLVTATGNVTAANFITSGLVTATGNINGANLNITTGIQVGASGLTATGNVRGGNIVSDAQITAVGNITGDNLITQGVVTATGNITANNVSAGNIVSTVRVNATGNVSAAGNVTGGNLVTGGFVTVTGNVNAGAIYTSGQLVTVGNITTSGFFIGDGGYLSNVTAVSNIAAQQIANGTTVMAVASANGNIFATINSIGNVMVMWPGGVNVTGIFSATGNVNGANVNATANVSAVGNVNGGNIYTSGIANIGTLITTNINASALTSGTVSSDRLSGTYLINVTGNVSGTAATVTNATQSNITSVGTLTSLSVSGNITGGNVNTAGLVSATGNINGGNLNAAGLSLSGNVISAINTTSAITTTANITGGNVNTAGLVSATGNINGGNLNAAGLSLSGNVISAINSTANVTTTANIAGGNIIGTHVGNVAGATTISASGNITGGNINTAGLVSATGNINGGNLNGTSIAGTLITATQTNITSVGTLGSLAVTGNITSGNLSGTSIVGTLTTATQTNITSVGTLGSLSVTGNITGGGYIGTVYTNSIINSGANATGNIGSASTYFNRLFATATTALYADVAEKYTSDAKYAPGTVLAFGGEKEVTISNVYQDRRVAGVVSTTPAHLMNAGLQSEHTVDVALVGRVPCLVQGNVTKGDLMVSAGNGRACAELNPSVGAVIGKALENFVGDHGTIEVVVGRI
jgi:hypothetical protein